MTTPDKLREEINELLRPRVESFGIMDKNVKKTAQDILDTFFAVQKIQIEKYVISKLSQATKEAVEEARKGVVSALRGENLNSVTMLKLEEVFHPHSKDEK